CGRLPDLRLGGDPARGQIAAIDRVRLPDRVDDGEKPDERRRRTREGGHAAVVVEEDEQAEGPGEREGALVEAEIEVSEPGEDRQESGEPGRLPVHDYGRGLHRRWNRRRRRSRGRRRGGSVRAVR